MSDAHKTERQEAPRIIIIGAGAAGLAMGIRLQQAGMNNFTIYEKSDEIGGTWRENRYPGVGCDVPAHHYNYSFEHNPGWHSRLAGGAELQAYFLNVTKKYNLRPHIVFGHAIKEAEFDGECWTILTDKGRQDAAKFLIAATGPLHVPNYPDIDGLDRFKGQKFHSARWPQDIDLKDKRVGVIGTGSSGVQIISALAREGVDLTVFMRTPQWVFPLKNRRYSKFERGMVQRFPWIGRKAGAVFKWFFEGVFAIAVVRDGWQRSLLSWMCRRNLASIKDPDLRRRLTPPDRPLCKRLVMSADFYPALQMPNVKLVQDQISHAEARGLVTADETLHELDVLVMATGFWSRAYGRPLELTNEEGLTLTEAWKDEVGAHLSIHVPGFPNYMIISGPRSPRGNFSAIAFSEAIIDHIMKCITFCQDNRYKSIAARPEAMERFNDEIRAGLANTTWIAGCQSWYLNEKGEPENWTGTPDEFRAICQTLNPDDFIFKAPDKIEVSDVDRNGQFV